MSTATDTVLCQVIKENNIKLPMETLASIVAYLALSRLDEGDVYGALDVLDSALRSGIYDPRLEKLKDRIEASLDVARGAEEVSRLVSLLLAKMSADNVIDPSLLRRLGESIRGLESAVVRARNLGLDLDVGESIAYARDVYRLLGAVADKYGAVQEVGDLLNRLQSYIENRFSDTGSVEAFAAALRGLGEYYSEAAAYKSRLEQVIDSLSSVELDTPEARRLRDEMIRSVQALLPVLDAVRVIGDHARIMGTWLSRVMDMVKRAYDDPSDSPFGAARANFVNLVASLLQESMALRQDLARIPYPSGRAGDVVSALKRFGAGIADSVSLALMNLKYTTTFNDYRWNEIWEEAESKARYDLGRISQADVQKYEFKGCDSLNHCNLAKRSGAVGWLAEHAPEEVLRFWTSLEEVLRDIEMYNKWAMKYLEKTYHPALATIGYLGYMGASIIGATGSLFTPRLLAEHLSAFSKLIGDWASALKSRSREKISRVAGETWRVFFGSKEAALATIGTALLSLAAFGLMSRGLPKGAKLPLRRAVTANLLAGDLIGAGLEVVLRAAPAARLAGTAARLVRNGVVRASEILDNARLIEKVAEKASKTARVKALASLGALKKTIKQVIDRADTLEKARQHAAELIRETGAMEMKKLIEEYRAAKTTLASNLRSLNVVAPTLVNRLKNLARRLTLREIPEEALPPTLKKAIENAQKVVMEGTGNAVKTAEAAAGDATRLLQLFQRDRRVAEAVGLSKRMNKIIEELRGYRRSSPRLVEAMERLNQSYQKLVGEIARTKAILDSIRKYMDLIEMAEEKGLWKETITLSKRKLRPGRGFLRKETINVRDLLKEHLWRAEERYRALLGRKKQLERRLTILTDELSERILVEQGIEKATRGRKLVPKEYPTLSEEAFGLGGTIEALASEVMETVGKAQKESLKQLGELGKVAEAMDKSPIGAMLSELEAGAEAGVHIVETGVAEGRTVKPKAVESLRELFQADTPVYQALVKLMDEFGEAWRTLEKELEADPNTARVLDYIHEEVLPRSPDLPPRTLMEMVEEYVSENGIRLGEGTIKKIQDMIEAEWLARRLREIKELAESGKPIELERIQSLIDEIATMDPALAKMIDWEVVYGSIRDVVEKAKTAEQAARRGEEAVAERRFAYELEGKIIEAIEKAMENAGVLVKKQAVLREGASELARTMRRAYELLTEVFGEDATKRMKELLDLFERDLKDGVVDKGLLDKLNKEIAKFKLKNVHNRFLIDITRLVNKLDETLTRLAKGKEPAMLKQALNQLADTIKRVEDKIEIGEGWVTADRALEVWKTKNVLVDRAFAQKIARILSTREKHLALKTAEGYEVKATRRIDIEPNGTMIISYEIEFPGGRKINYSEIVGPARGDKIPVYTSTVYDPPVQRALTAYQEYLQGTRPLDSLAREGQTIYDMLKDGLAKIDPDYEILSRIALRQGDKITRLLAPLEEAIAKTLAMGGATATALLARTGLEALATEALATQIQEAIETLRAAGPEALGEKELLALSATPPMAATLSRLYPVLKRPEEELDEETWKKLEEELGAPVLGVGKPDDGISLGGGGWPEGTTPYLVFPSYTPEILQLWNTPEGTVTLRVSGLNIVLPAVTIGGKVFIILPPFYFEIPDYMMKELEGELQGQSDIDQALEGPELMTVQRLREPEGGGGETTPATPGEGATGPAAPPFPLIPIPWPWEGGGHAAQGKERERLNII